MSCLELGGAGKSAPSPPTPLYFMGVDDIPSSSFIGGNESNMTLTSSNSIQNWGRGCIEQIYGDGGVVI